MQRILLLVSLAAALTAPTTTAQVNAAFSTFGAGCPGTGTGLGGTQILPAAAATTWGAGNAIPLGWSPNRYQQVFLGSELPLATTLAGLSGRQPRTGPTSTRFTVDLQIQVGYTTRSLSTLGTSFANNWDAGAPVTVLPRAQVVLPDQPPPPPANPSTFVFTIPWTNTFDWVPQAGRNLLIEVTVFGNSYNNGIWGYPLDNVGGTQALWGTPATATTGSLRGFGMVMGFVEQTHTAMPRLYSTNTPQIGDQFRVRLSQALPRAFALMLTGLSNSQWNGQLLPYDLGTYGAPGCPLLVGGDAVTSFPLDSGGAGFVVFTLPNDIYLLNMAFHNQALVVDPAANLLGIATSNGGTGLIGNQ